jgi:hypothetical protein
MAWRVSEKAPVITAWLAVMVAIVAMPTSGRAAHSGTELEERDSRSFRDGSGRAPPARK